MTPAGPPPAAVGGVSRSLFLAVTAVAAAVTLVAVVLAVLLLQATSEPDTPNLEKVAYEKLGDRGWSGDEDTVTVVVYGHASWLDEFLEELGFSPAVSSRTARTRALDGTQRAQGDNVNATWTYHPDSGLQVVFEVED